MGKLIEFLTDRFFGDKVAPRLEISLEKIGASVEPDPADPGQQVIITWKMKLFLDNETDAHAADLEQYWPGGKSLFEVKTPYFVDHFEKKAAAFQIQRILPSNRLGSDESEERLWELLPDELREMTFVVSYRSHRGDTFYTKFSGKDGSNEYMEALPPEFLPPA